MFGEIFRPNILVPTYVLILRNLQLIKYLKANHLVKNFVIYKFFIPTKFTTPGLGVSKMPHLQQSHAIKRFVLWPAIVARPKDLWRAIKKF